jgi:hypothetical protein
MHAVPVAKDATSDLDPLADLTSQLIDQWDRMSGQQDASGGEMEMAQFEGLPLPRRPRGGLAIGRSRDERTGKQRLEMRVTAQAGPNYRAAEKLAATARTQGVEVILEVIKNAIIGRAPPPATIAGRREPLHIGASIANRESLAGTLGAFVKLPDGEEGMLSCSHVLARTGRKWGKVGDPIHQPGAPEEKLVTAKSQIGTLSDCFAPFIDSQTNNLDAAVARMDRRGHHEGNVIPTHDCVPLALRGKRIGKPLDDVENATGIRVCKVGRSTGYTEAQLSATSFQNMRVELGRTKVFTFSDIYEVLWDDGQDFAAAGDSGSLVMACDGLLPLGLHFASMEGVAGKRVSYVIPWQRIAATFDLQPL